MPKVDSMGQGGIDIISDTNEHNGNYIAVMAVGGDVTPDTLTASVGDDLDSEVLTQNVIIPGPFTHIKLAAGKVYAWLAKTD